MKAKLVIRIGRSRSLAASTADSMQLAPARIRSSANSMIRIAFLEARPMVVISPTCR